ncbi:hypothetical protein D3C71_1720920 [compost metagenome]
MLHAGKEFLQIDSGVAESLLCFLLGSGNLLHQGLLVLSDTDPFASAACSGLHDDRIADISAQHDRFFHIAYKPV